MRNCKLSTLWKLWQNNVFKKVEKCYSKCILMVDPLRSLIVWSLSGKPFIDFRISTSFEAHSFQTDFIFEIIFSSLSKGIFNSVFKYFRLNLIPEVIIQRIAVWWFWRALIILMSRYGFFQKILNEIAGLGCCTILNENLIFLWIGLINGRK